MSNKRDNSPEQKISAPFRSRLSKLSAREKVRALVLVRTGQVAKGTGRRQSAAERKAAVDAIKAATTAALPEIDEILGQFDGRRLADVPNAMGCLPVETTSAGVEAIAQSELVEAILEDQPISLLQGR